MHTFNYITNISLVIPESHISHMCHRLAQLLERREIAMGAATGFDEHERLPYLLGLSGWRADWQPDGSLKLVEFTGESLDLVDDPVLESAVGGVRAGCFVEGYAEDNAQWQIRYYASSKQQVCGRVAWPPEPEWERHFRSMLVLRDGRDADLPQLSAFSPIASTFTQERLLVAERGDKLVGFLAYVEDGRAGVITHIATVVNGWRYGYPQALVTYLQKQFQELRVKNTKHGYNRIWKALGFSWRSSIFEAGGTHSSGSYVWPAPEEPTAPMGDAGELRRQLDVALLGLKVQYHLTEPESETLRCRFALLDGKWQSLEEIARRIGTTPDKVRQHQAKALRKLRTNREFLALLKSYLQSASPPLTLRPSIAWLAQEPEATPHHPTEVYDEKR